MSDTALATIIRHDAYRVMASIRDWSPLTGKSVLLTGGTGLIGLHMLAVLEKLHDAGVVKSVMFTGKSDLSGVAAIIGEFATYFQCDLTNTAHLAQLPYDQDCIIHAAGYGQPGKFLENELKTLSLNTTVTNLLSSHLSKNGLFLFLSSSEVYSGSPRLPYKEDDIGSTSPLHPRACYIEGKRCGEAICNCLSKQGIQCHIARVSLTYGPGTRPGDQRVINQFIHQALTSEAIHMRDAGEAIRTYCYVSDTVECLFRIILHGRGLVYNVGGKSRTTISKLAELIASKACADIIKPSVAVTQDGAPKEVWVDITKIADEFGKTTFVSLRDGVDATIDYQRIMYEDISNRS